MVHKKWTIFLLVFCVGVMYIVTRSASSKGNTTLTVSYIDVGQGDSIWVHDSNGFDILIDGGKPSAGPTVLAYLRDHGIDDIEVMIASHPDNDHIGGLIDVLNATDIPVQQVIYSGYPGDTATWDSFTTAVANEGITLTIAQYPSEYTWGSATAYILSPTSGLSNSESNDAWVVMLLAYGNVKFLFPGDIRSTVGATVVAHGTPVAAQILKVAHHGSAHSPSTSFLSAANPKEAVISVGVNSYGHPSADTINRLLAAGAKVWRTDLCGTIVVTSDGTTYNVTSSCGWTVYLPLIMNSSTPPNTQTPTPTATSTPTPTGTKPPCQSLRMYGTVTLGSSSGTGVAGVSIELAIATYGFDQVALTDANGDYEAFINTQCHQETLRLRAVLSGHSFIPSEYIWPYYGYGGTMEQNFVMDAVMTQTPTPTAALTPTPTQAATSTPASSGNMAITTIFYNGAGNQKPDEYVEISNDATYAIQLQNWTLRDIANHVYTFPNFVMQPGQVCRVYTNESHPEWCGFNHESGAAIWNDTGVVPT